MQNEVNEPEVEPQAPADELTEDALEEAQGGLGKSRAFGFPGGACGRMFGPVIVPFSPCVLTPVERQL